MYIYDSQVWDKVDANDLWIYDKLILCRKLGYVCGPAGVPLPKPGTYIVKPITNILGMGVGSYFHEFTDTDTDFLAPGTFWMEVFTGPHVSVDVVDGKTDIVYEGIRDGIQRFSRWTKLDVEPQHEPFVIEMSKKYGVVNYETIGGKIIEVHLRANPDWHKHKARELIPVWEGDEIPKENFVSDPDIGRLGFVVVR